MNRTHLAGAVFALVALGSGVAHATTSFTYTLPVAATTSAGAYKPDGTLVRTLWRKVDKQAGADTQTWDDKDDSGNTVPAGTYQIRVLYHNVQYVWEGTVGNTSDSQIGNSLYRGYKQIQSISCITNRCFFALGYNELQAGMHHFDIATPETQVSMPRIDAYAAFEYLASDGTNVYWANNGGLNEDKFVVATKVTDDSLVTFSSGVDRCLHLFESGPTCYEDSEWPSVIDEEMPVTASDGGVVDGGDTIAHISGIAVQTSGNYLIVAHDTQNSVHVLNKTTGALVKRNTITNPRFPVVDTGGDLWTVVTDGGTDAIEKFTVSSTDGTLTPVSGAKITDFTTIGALALSPDGTTILVADVATAVQQVKAFSTTTYMSTWTLGRLGGYGNDPTVGDDHFDFTTGTLLAYEADGSFWVGETDNYRTLHFTPARVVDNRIMYLPATYSAGADVEDPSRVYGNFLEFHVDYSKTLAGNNGSWIFVKNWSIGLDPKYQGFASGIGSPKTLSNGRTYAMLIDSTNGTREIVELPATGPAREAVNLPAEPDHDIEFVDNGDIRNATLDGGLQTVFVQALSGFDSNANPTWSSPVAFGSAPTTADKDPKADSNIGPFQIPFSSSDVAVIFDSDLVPGFHLGGIARGGTQWLWEASPTGPLDGLRTYDIGDGVMYGGNVAMTSGHNIVYGYHGEFWMSGEASQWMHFYDDGLFVGQFGTYGTATTTADGAVAGFAGNSFSPQMVVDNCKTYLWHNDESNHAGVIRWRLDGLSDIQEVTGSGSLDTTITLSDTIDAGAPTCIPVDGGADNNVGMDAGSQVNDSGTVVARDGGSIVIGSSDGGMDSGFTQGGVGSSRGCGCRVVSPRENPRTGAWMLGLSVLAGVVLRRRTKTRNSA